MGILILLIGSHPQTAVFRNLCVHLQDGLGDVILRDVSAQWLDLVGLQKNSRY